VSDSPETAEMRQVDVDRIQAKMLKRTLFVMFRQVVDPAKFRPALRDHLLWLIKLEEEGLIFASGPAFKVDGSPAPGMTIFRVASFEEAATLAASDPVCLAGGAEFHIHRWSVGAGRLTLSVKFSDQTYRFD
jgi:uncharacterized protein YciI